MPTQSRGTAKIMPIKNEPQATDGLHKLDPQVIGAIYDRYFPEIYRYVRYRINDDVVADATRNGTWTPSASRSGSTSWPRS